MSVIKQLLGRLRPAVGSFRNAPVFPLTRRKVPLRDPQMRVHKTYPVGGVAKVSVYRDGLVVSYEP